MLKYASVAIWSFFIKIFFHSSSVFFSFTLPFEHGYFSIKLAMNNRTVEIIQSVVLLC